MLKQIDPTTISMDGVEFAIYPFGAMYASNLSVELGKMIGPVFVGLLPAVAGDDSDGSVALDLNKAMPMITGAFAALDGDKAEELLDKLLLRKGNISCQYRDQSGSMVQEVLNQSLLDSLFCQNVDGLLRLAVEVIKVNCSGFFEKLLTQSGGLEKNLIRLVK